MIDAAIVVFERFDVKKDIVFGMVDRRADSNGF
jgi:hypothetical protein